MQAKCPNAQDKKKASTLFTLVSEMLCGEGRPPSLCADSVGPDLCYSWIRDGSTPSVWLFCVKENTGTDRGQALGVIF